MAGPRPPVQSDKPQQGAPPVAARPMSPEHDDDDEDDDDDETSGEGFCLFVVFTFKQKILYADWY